MFESLIREIYDFGEEYENEVFLGMPYSQYGNLESLYLYCFIRSNKLKYIIELGCERNSRSSYIIQKALLKNGGGTHIMCDFEDVLNEAFNNLFDTSGVIKMPGDIRDTYKDLIPHLEKCDFLFIDAHHERDFAVFYLDNLIPHLRSGVDVHIHDINLSGDWVDRDGRENEALELITRHKNDTLNLKKRLWLEDISVNEKYKDIFNIISRRHMIGKFPATSLPFNASASYWKVK